MERQSERQREIEREPLILSYEYRFITQNEDRDKVQTLPRVFKLNLIPTTEDGMMRSRGKHKIFGDHLVYHRLTRAPLYTLTCDYYILPKDAARRGAHRHVGSALFYIVKGKGYEKQNGLTFEYEEGDVFVVPPFTIHQHFPDPELGCEAFVPKPSISHYLGLYWREQREFGENPILPAGTEPIRSPKGELIGYRIKKGMYGANRDLEVYLGVDPKWDELFALRRKVTRWQDSKPETTYDYYLKLLAQDNMEQMTHTHVVKGKEVPWENTRQGRLKYLVGPHLPAGKWTFDVFLQEIPPGSRSGQHLHLSEELHLILEGKGYDIQDGVRYDWERGDLVCIPVGTVHQHFNADPKQPAKFVAAQPRFWADRGYGGFLQLENAPEYA